MVKKIIKVMGAVFLVMLLLTFAIAAIPAETKLASSGISWFNGLVGIGTDSPSVELDVEGSIIADSIGEIYYVNSGNGSDIQAKINLAESNGGGTIIIPDGNYTTERINVSSNITIKCVSLSSKILQEDDGGNYSLINIEGDNVVIEGCYFKEGLNVNLSSNSNPSQTYEKAIIFSLDQQNIVIQNNYIEMKNTENGNAISFAYNNLDNQYNYARNNILVGGRNAIFFYDSNIITNNKAFNQTHACYYGRLPDDNIISENFCDNSGTGILLEGASDLTSKNNIISNNIITNIFNGHVIKLDYIDYSNVLSNMLFNGSFSGILLKDSRYNNIENNVIDSMSQYSIWLNTTNRTSEKNFINFNRAKDTLVSGTTYFIYSDDINNIIQESNNDMSTLTNYGGDFELRSFYNNRIFFGNELKLYSKTDSGFLGQFSPTGFTFDGTKDIFGVSEIGRGSTSPRFEFFSSSINIRSSTSVDFETSIAKNIGELEVDGISSDGTGKVVCIKSDGDLGTCTDQPDVSGVCTCS